MGDPQPSSGNGGKKLSLRLSNLRSFNMSVIEDSSHLTHIDLRNNRLSTLPDQLCDLPSLKELRLDYNFLSALPARLNLLQKLEYLSASQNSLKSIPGNLFELRDNLKHLVLNDNKIGVVPGRLGNLHNLETLLLH